MKGPVRARTRREARAGVNVDRLPKAPSPGGIDVVRVAADTALARADLDSSLSRLGPIVLLGFCPVWARAGRLGLPSVPAGPD